MTPQEIKMFDTKEIQEGWKPKVGDRIWDKINRKVEVVCNVEEGLTTGYHLTISNNVVAISTRFIFLPSIEQMAEMWNKELKYPHGFRFFHAVTHYLQNMEYNIDFGANYSAQIITLHFIMKENGLVWLEEGWAEG